MSKQLNDNAYMLIRLHEKSVKLVIIAGKSMGLKGEGNLPSYENMDGIEIFRLYDNYQMFLSPQKEINKILEIAKTLKPDLIFCSQELNMRLALLIQKFIKKPIVLLVEDAGRIFSGEAYSSLKIKSSMLFFGIPTGPKFWSWLCEKADALITCSPRDQANLESLSNYNKPIYFLPWPAHIPKNFEFGAVRNRGKAVYVGSLSQVKNTQEFEHTLPAILRETETTQFVIVGLGPHVPIIKKLREQYDQKIIHIPQLPRYDALKLISSSYYAYTPVVTGGWGFIGDCWSMKTPIVMTHNDNYVINNKNALVVDGIKDLVQKINLLYKQQDLYQALQENGFREYSDRSASVVANKLYSILASVI
jgi:glycosyltransferase involved in cell wall biosynthesis